MTMTTTILTLLALLLSLWSIEAAINVRNAWGRRSTLNGLKISVRELQARHDSDKSAEAITLDAAPGSAQPEEQGTIVLPGMPHLEWMTENLQGFGGTEIDGRWYYTYEQAEEAVKQLGDGWRLPTRGEMVDLDDQGSTWDDDRKGRWFGGNHDTDHDGSLFFPAVGSRAINNGGGLCYVGTNGYVWSSSPVYAGNNNAGYLSFDSGAAHPLFSARRANGCSVRYVRNVQ